MSKAPTTDRLQGLRDYYVGQNVDGAGDVEDLFHEIDRLTAELEQARDYCARPEGVCLPIPSPEPPKPSDTNK